MPGVVKEHDHTRRCRECYHSQTTLRCHKKTVIEKLFHFTLSESAARRLGEIAEYYLLVQLDTNIQRLNYSLEIAS